ncbi:ABC transporter ATP-binding protein [Geoglobus acetivorans]|uniref:ABC transporter, ATP-binding protein n=1 Tax=Geoglobus acetivorans TaxID=565033 RepID=A0A0A7GF60_GEOAI|nr:ABC transporter, ATP-binding protein [Geoglobus acetivorans]
MIELKNVEKSFGRVKVLKGVSFSVSENERVALLGPNGSGKTTTVRIITGQIRPTRGSVVVCGSERIDESVKSRMGVVSHNTFLYDDLTAYENLRFFAGIYGVDDGRIRELLEQFGLWRRRHDLVRNYSRGMKQRLSIARALLNEPDILILDEPTTGLDVEGRERLFEAVRDYKSTLLFTTHNLGEAEELCERVVMLRDGEIVYDGEIEDVEETYRRVML